MKVLLIGDSFAADWSSVHAGCQGWCNILAQQYQTVNLAQAGVSEYKIWLQLESQDLSTFSHVIMSHTSPYRIPIDHHPIHHRNPFHKNCDLMYEDIKAHQSTEFDALIQYFENWFDLKYARFVHQLIIHRQIDHVIQHASCQVLHLNPLGLTLDTRYQMCMDFYKIFLAHRGRINHFNDQGNIIVAEEILSWIRKT